MAGDKIFNAGKDTYKSRWKVGGSTLMLCLRETVFDCLGACVVLSVLCLCVQLSIWDVGQEGAHWFRTWPWLSFFSTCPPARSHCCFMSVLPLIQLRSTLLQIFWSSNFPLFIRPSCSFYFLMRNLLGSSNQYGLVLDSSSSRWIYLCK